MTLIKIKDRLPEEGRKVTVWARNKYSGNIGSLSDCYIQVNDKIELEWRYVPSGEIETRHCVYFDHYSSGQWIPEEWEDKNE